jgi:phosphopantothenoylcysteine decarboxylase / phosphopantothenate---cysteine ligase
MGHIRLSRDADAILVCPATANFLAHMAAGLANDLATTILLASDKPVFVCPAMNGQMWNHPATQHSLTLLQQRGVHVLPPEEGVMACGEWGKGRLPPPSRIVDWLVSALAPCPALHGKTALVTSGGTHEPLDPVRYLGNLSSGRQGNAIAEALVQAGVRVTLVQGATSVPPPAGVTLVSATTARAMLAACEEALPVDMAICAAAVADWRPVAFSAQKLKKSADGASPVLSLVENPDILHTLSTHPTQRPTLVIGFALETEATAVEEKRRRKNCDWILANTHTIEAPAFGETDNALTLHKSNSAPVAWPRQPKAALARLLVNAIGEYYTHLKS